MAASARIYIVNVPSASRRLLESITITVYSLLNRFAANYAHPIITFCPLIDHARAINAVASDEPDMRQL